MTGSIDYPGRIVGGDDTAPWEYPWMAALLTKSSNKRPFCGGSLISPVHVLTAAHCAKHILPDPTSFRVRIGEHNFDSELETDYRNFRVQNVSIHPNYTSSYTIKDDLAILELNASCMDKPRTVCLPEVPNDFRNHEAVVIGWGVTEAGKNQPPILQEVTVEVYPQVKCEEAYENFKITDSHLCAGIQENGGKDSCQGDSGGPLHVKLKGRWVQVGIVSFGIGCAEALHPGVYTNVSSYLSWIADVLDPYTLNDELCGESLEQDPKMFEDCPNGAVSSRSLIQALLPSLTIPILLFSISSSFLPSLAT
ncbi:unnamed protein product [Darwinula stevensoni]|nr:unnamed protein product [Darwinula stevensoni]CAG0884199.1 unnamed protein product [Darwinula stevensoni]